MIFDGNKSALIKLARQQIALSRPITGEQMRAREMSLESFVKQFWHIVEPSTPLIWSWHLSALCEHIEALYRGTLGVNRLLATVPPGSMKSTVMSVMAPAWWWVTHPEFRSIFASGAAAVSSRDSMKCRSIIESTEYRETFGIQWTFAEDENLKTSYRNSMTGFRVATTSGAKVTGARADGLFMDDLLDASDAYSKAERDKVNNWLATTFGNRFNDLRTGIMGVIMQRLHGEDVAGFILATEPQLWCHLSIPQLWDESQRKVTSLGWTDPRTVDGELMFPERFPADIIAAEKNRLGSSAFAGQHQQRPSAAEGEIFKRGHLQLLSADVLPTCSEVIISLDTAFSLKTTADYSVMLVMGRIDRGFVILDLIRERYAYPQLRKVTEELAARWKPTAVLVEEKASGQSLVQSLQQETTLPVVPVKVDADKISRANTVTPTWEAHRVFAPIGAPWLQDFEEELYAFPKAPHDDQVDALVQALQRFTLLHGGAALTAWYKKNSRIAQTQAKAETADDPHHVTEAVYLNGASKRPKKPAPLWARPGVKVESL